MKVSHSVRTAVLAGVALTALSFAALCTAASAQGTGKLKVGLMLPYSGTFAALGNNITDAIMLAINEKFGFVRQPAWITFIKEL